MIRPGLRLARVLVAVVAVSGAAFAFMPFSGATAQTPPRAPRTPPPVTTNIPPRDFDLGGLARLEDLRLLDMAPLSRSLESLRLLDMAPLSRSLESLKSLDLSPLHQGLRELSRLDMAPLTQSLDNLQLDMHGLSSLSNLSSLSGLSDLSNLSHLSMLQDLPVWQSFPDFEAWQSFPDFPRWQSFPRWSDDSWSDRTRRMLPPEAWQDKDPADSLYRLARKALSSDSYRRASELYRQIRRSYPKSAYTPDAPYWEAFSLQRLGGQQDLKTAVDVLRAQLSQFPNAATVSEARALQARLEGQLARLGDVNFVAKVQENARSATSSNCPRESEDERIDALDALIQMDAESALPMLKKVLARRDECSATLRKKAVWLVGSRKTPEAADIIINTIRNDPDRDVKETAIFWLTNAPSDKATDLLVELARSGNDNELRQRAVYSLSQLRDPRGRQALKDIVLDNSAPTDLRGDAINALVYNGRGRGFGLTHAGGGQQVGGGQQTVVSSGSGSGIGSMSGTVSGTRVGTASSASSGTGSGKGSGASSGMGPGTATTMSGQQGFSPSGSDVIDDLLPFLKQVYAKVDQYELKERVLQAAMQLRSESARDWMVEIANNPKESSDARRQAVYAAGSAGASIEQLSAMYDKGDDIEVRKQVLYMLSSRKESAAIDKLILIAKTEKEPEIRKQVIYWLGRSKDPRAIQVLQEIINK